jgi:hypothetical protein
MPRRTPVPDAPPDPLQRWRDRDATPSLFSDVADHSDVSDLPSTPPPAPSPRSGEGGGVLAAGRGSSSKSSRHSGVLAREQDRSHAKTGKSSPGNRSGREIVIDELKDALWTYLTKLGIGARFQAVDFLSWLDAGRYGGWKPPADFDLRAMGGLWSRLMNTGTIERVGFAPNGGRVSAESNYGSTTRPVYRITKLNMHDIGWYSATGEPPAPAARAGKNDRSAA